jgi:hypothetical protein
MARRPNALPSIKVTVTASPKLALYLTDLVSEEGYGANPSEVAKSLIWRAIEQLIESRVIERRRGPLDKNGE